MIIGISGANGFLGRNLFRELNKMEEIEIVQFGREPSKEKGKNSRFIEWDILDNEFDYSFLPKLDKYFHLAWSGIPNYDDEIHLDQLKNHVKFITAIMENGCNSILATGTCFEYANPVGRVSEDFPTSGSTAYSKAKIQLHNILKELTDAREIQFLWARIFYLYGEGQPKKTLYGSFLSAVATQELEFATRNGRNTLDYSEVSVLARSLIKLLSSTEASGTYNVGSGVGTQISALLEEWKRQNRSSIQIVDLELSPTQNFWADISKLESIII